MTELEKTPSECRAARHSALVRQYEEFYGDETVVSDFADMGEQLAVVCLGQGNKPEPVLPLAQEATVAGGFGGLPSQQLTGSVAATLDDLRSDR